MSQLLAVRYPGGRSRALAWLLCGVCALVWLLVFLSCFGPLASDHQAWRAIVLIVLALASSLALWRLWRQQLPAELEWNGEHWLLGAEPRTWRAEVRLDAQRWMLLRLVPAERRGAPRWLWVQASSAPQRWHLLRCALYLPQTAAARHEAATSPDAERA